MCPFLSPPPHHEQPEEKASPPRWPSFLRWRRLDGDMVPSEALTGPSIISGPARQAPPLLTLIRHPETVANISHVLQGVTDSPLTVNGQRQAERLCQAVAEAVRASLTGQDGQTRRLQPSPLPAWDRRGEVVRPVGPAMRSPLVTAGRPLTLLLTSPVGRALNLAKGMEEAITSALATLEKDPDGSFDGYRPPQVTIRPGLAERNFGPGEGKVYGNRAKDKVGLSLVDPIERAGLVAESHVTFHQRVAKEVAHLVQLLRDDENAHVVVVSHGLWIRTALNILMGQVRHPFTGNTGLYTLALLDTTPGVRAKFALVSQNDLSHLQGMVRQRGGIGSSASDRRQQTLAQSWSNRPPQESSMPSAYLKEDDNDTTPTTPTKRPVSPLRSTPPIPSPKRQKNLLQMWTRPSR